MIEDKLKQLKEEYDKVIKELERLNQIGLKLAGAIEVLQGMEEKPVEPEVVKDKNKDK
mgnify:CR=1 FL=1|tara:strand:- start:1503 stop:1676 length:174 start_codon:yes stop_codon:yes gene_type:complete